LFVIPPLKAQMTICSKNLWGGMAPYSKPFWLRLCLQAELSTAWHQNNEPTSWAMWVSYRQINCYCKK